MQFGHLFARGDTRTAAVRAMVVALKEVKIRGEIRTLVDYAIDMIQVGVPILVHSASTFVNVQHSCTLHGNLLEVCRTLHVEMLQHSANGTTEQVAARLSTPGSRSAIMPSLHLQCSHFTSIYATVARVHQQPHPHRVARLPHRCPGAKDQFASPESVM